LKCELDVIVEDEAFARHIMSRVGYRALLEAGVRVFEWKGSMLHAKTAVADGRWARVGSTNLNTCRPYTPSASDRKDWASRLSNHAVCEYPWNVR